MTKLTKEQQERYFCSTFLKNIKEEGQIRLLNSRVLVVGAGGLGSHALTILATSGVGHITIIDNDIVKIDNLPRQSIYEYKDIGKSKGLCAKRRLKKLNPDVDIKVCNTYLNESNAKRLLRGYDIILDCTDNFESKFLINDTCLKLNVPFVIAGVSDYQGQVMTCLPKRSKDFKSLFSELPVNIDEKHKEEDQGVFPPAVAIIANIAASEVMKYIIGLDNLLLNCLLVVNTLKNHFQIIEIK